MIQTLKLITNNSHITLPNWITFAFSLGAFLYDEGIKNRKRAHIAITLPSDKYFSLFVLMGISDQIYSVRKQMRSIRNQVMSLKPGSRVIFRDSMSSRKVSVLGIKPSPYKEGELLLYIQDKGFERGIPERSWLENIFILDEKYDDIKRTRKVSSKKQLGINSLLLKELYSEDSLIKTAFYPKDFYYIVGNRFTLEQQISEVFFSFNGVKGSIKDFLYVENLINESSYINGRFFSSQLKKMDYEISDAVPVIFSDTTSFRKQNSFFSSNPSLLILNRTEQEHKIEEVTAELSRKFIEQDITFITNEVLDYINSYPAATPCGIEFFAWRE